MPIKATARKDETTRRRGKIMVTETRSLLSVNCNRLALNRATYNYSELGTHLNFCSFVEGRRRKNSRKLFKILAVVYKIMLN